MNIIDTRLAASWCPGHRIVALARNQKRHKAETRHLDHDGGTHGHTQTQLGDYGRAVGGVQTRLVQAKLCVKRVAPHNRPGHQRLCPHDDGGRYAATDLPHGGNPPRLDGARQRQCPAVDEEGTQRDLERQAGDLDSHHRFGARHGRVEAAVDGKQHGGGQREGQGAEVAAYFFGNVRASFGQFQKWPG
jgi:hypothetical protein